MNTETIGSHSNVIAALDSVKKEVEKELSVVCSAGGDALKSGKIAPSKAAIASAEKLKAFAKKVEELGEEWTMLAAEIGVAEPKGNAPVAQPALPQVANTEEEQSVLTVNFGEGYVGWKVLVDVIRRLGIKRVAEVVVRDGLKFKKCPLVSQDRGAFEHVDQAGKASAIKRITDDEDVWYVNTYANPKDEMRPMIKRLAAKLGMNVDINDHPEMPPMLAEGETLVADFNDCREGWKVFVDAIHQLGVKRVAEVVARDTTFRFNGCPLISQNRDVFQKMAASVRAVKDEDGVV